MSRPRVRFAPSPTGRLHLGNGRIALVNWLLAKSAGGAFVLRFDDTDKARSEERFVAGIEEDLRWLGLVWDERHRQSERMDRYRSVFEKLVADGRLYPCYETPEELEAKRKRRLRQRLPPIYDRAALELTDAERKTFVTEGRRAHWRFKLDDAEIAWDDLVLGPKNFDTRNLSDPVVVREDGTFLYMLPSAIDDVDMKITHVVRGEDHVTNAALQIQMMEALDAPAPAFAHLPLMLDASGGPLSKREGALSLEDIRARGIEPGAVVALLAALGSSEAPDPAADLSALAARFDISRFGRAGPRFDPAELGALNAKVLHAMPFAKVEDRLAAAGLGGAGEAFWHAVGGNLNAFEDAKAWHAVCFGRIDPVLEDPALLAAAARLLPPEPWDEATWGAWTKAVGAETGKKGKALFHPLRLALTGRDQGPEMKALLPLIGRSRALGRLGGRTFDG